MADLRIWKPWYARIPGATVAAIGTVIAFPCLVFMLPAVFGISLIDLGLHMMRRKEVESGSGK